MLARVLASGLATMARQAEALEIRETVGMAAILEGHYVVCFDAPYFDTARQAVSAEGA